LVYLLQIIRGFPIFRLLVIVCLMNRVVHS
jgi:hypothetical protein